MEFNIRIQAVVLTMLDISYSAFKINFVRNGNYGQEGQLDGMFIFCFMIM
jgi:hypothetical protein